MNRRTFLLGLATAACSGAPPRPVPSRREPDGDDENSIGTQKHGVEPERDGPAIAQMLRSPLAIHGDVLVQSTYSALVFWDAIAMTPLGRVELSHNGFCALPDGTFAAVVQPDRAKRCELHVIDRDRNVRVLWGPELASAADSEIVPGRSETEVYVSDEHYDVVRFELRADELRTAGRIKLDLSPWRRLRQLTSLGDGRIVTRGDRKLYVSEPDKPTIEVATPSELPVHLARGSGGRIWYSHMLLEAPPHAIALGRFENTRLVKDASIELVPSQVWHLAACRGELAVLLRTEHAGAADDWEIALYDESGAQRWRTRIPTSFHEGKGLRDAYVAVSERRAVLLRSISSAALVAWDAATGKRV